MSNSARKLCKVAGCERPKHAHGMCGMHAQRMQRHGTTDAPLRRQGPIAQFWAKVDRRGETECWPWLGYRQPEGYGHITTRTKPSPSRTRLAHRAAYELLVGPIPPGLQLDHLCRNPCCVNPSHLEPVTPLENSRRGLHGVLRTHCRRGHPLIPENLVNGGTPSRRVCKVCQRENAARARQDPVKRERMLDTTRRWRAKQRASVRTAYEMAGAG